MIYYARQESTGHIKIGFSENPRARVRTVASIHRGPFTLLLAHRGGKDVEQAILLKFADYRAVTNVDCRFPAVCGHREFFYPQPELLEFVERQWRSFVMDICPQG